MKTDCITVFICGFMKYNKMVFINAVYGMIASRLQISTKSGL